MQKQKNNTPSNKELCRMAIPLRSITTGELRNLNFHIGYSIPT
jgi:hypothetical protein